MFAPSQWETSLQSNAVSHWLGANIESALCLHQTLCVVFSDVTFKLSPSGRRVQLDTRTTEPAPVRIFLRLCDIPSARRLHGWKVWGQAVAWVLLTPSWHFHRLRARVGQTLILGRFRLPIGHWLDISKCYNHKSHFSHSRFCAEKPCELWLLHTNGP